jgi:hypothetical protein
LAVSNNRHLGSNKDLEALAQVQVHPNLLLRLLEVVLVILHQVLGLGPKLRPTLSLEAATIHPPSHKRHRLLFLDRHQSALPTQ